MKWEDLKNKSTRDLQDMVVENRFEMQNLFFQAHGKQLKQVHKINDLRKTIARLNLLLQQREEEKLTAASAPADKQEEIIK